MGGGNGDVSCDSSSGNGNDNNNLISLTQPLYEHISSYILLIVRCSH